MCKLVISILKPLGEFGELNCVPGQEDGGRGGEDAGHGGQAGEPRREDAGYQPSGRKEVAVAEQPRRRIASLSKEHP